MTWAELIVAVRAQLDVTDDEAYGWLLDRARVMNAESDWLLDTMNVPSTAASMSYVLPADTLKVEAVSVGGYPYRRSTLAQLDVAKASSSSRCIYADTTSEIDGFPAVELWPPIGVDGTPITVRRLQDVPDDRAGSPPFPVDIHNALADGAIGMGMARMDERFDSAGYFDARFSDATQRLRRRRHSRVGRGGTPIRLVT
jgi:hypothetical protein